MSASRPRAFVPLLGAALWLTPVSAFSVDATTTTTLPGDCGNSVVDGAEDCDDGNIVAAPGQACGSGCVATLCGKASGSGGAKPTAGDALFALKSAVGSATCAPCVCDADDNGTIAAADALRLLRSAVGQAVELRCGACADLRRRGVFLIQDYTEIPVAARQEILLEKDYIEENGLELAEDGSRISWPVKPAAGWWIRFGDVVTVTNADGAFKVAIPEGEATTGTVAHPQQSDDPLFAISIANLVPPDTDPTPIVFEHQNFGPCGMNDDAEFPDPAQCTNIVAGQDSLHAASARAASAGGNDEGTHVHHHDHEASEFGNKEPAFTTGPRGTYPAGGQNCCKDYDGGTYDGGTLTGTILNYYGSTCQKFVDSGCCSGELGSIKNSILSSVGLLTPKTCQKNHKGRYCQEVTQGNLSVDVGGSVYIPFTFIGPPAIHLGETKSFTVHNNGCFGETAVEMPKREVFGVLSGAGYDGSSKINHSPTPPTYVPDVAMTYTSPRCVGSLMQYSRDAFRFSADGKWVELDVQIQDAGLYRFLPSGPVFSILASNRYGFHLAAADQCPGLHVHGPNPCTGAPEPAGAGPCGQGQVEPYTPKPRT